MLAQAPVGLEDLGALSKLLQDEEEQASALLVKTMRAERAAMAHMLKLAGNGEIDLHQLAGGSAHSPDAADKVFDWSVMQPLARYGQAPTLEFMTRHLKSLSLPPAERRAKLEALDRELRQMKANVHNHLEMMPAMILLPAIQKVVEAFDREQAILRCVRVALALERYHLAHRRWPDDPGALVPDLLPKVPDDPFGSGPLRYRRLPDGVVVYSVGPDGVDNGGVIDRVNPVKQGTDLGFRLWGAAKRSHQSHR